MIGDIVVNTSRSGHPLDLDQVALGDDERRRLTARGGAHRRRLLRRLRGARRRLGGMWPVRVRKTSSRVGRRSPTSSTADPLRRRAGAARRRAPRRRRTTGTSSDRACCSSTVTSPTASRPSSSRAAARMSAVLGDDDLQPLAADLRLQLVGGALRDHLAVVDHHDVVGQQVGLLEVLRGQQQRSCRPRPAPGCTLPHLGAAARVEARGRLVEEEHGRARDQRTGEVEPAPHAAGVGLRRAGRRRPRGGTAPAARAPGRALARRPRW